MKSITVELNSLKETPNDLFEFLYEIIDKQNSVSPEIKTFFIFSDIFELSKQALFSGCDIFKVEFVVDKIGIVKDLEIKTLISYIKALHKNNKDYYPCYLNNLLSKIAAIYPKKALLLVIEIEKLNYTFVPEGIFFLINDNSNLSVDEKYEYALSLINSRIEKQYMAGYVIIEKCIYDYSFTKKQEAVDLFHTVIKSKKEKELRAVVRPLCNLSLRELPFQDDVFSIKEMNDPYINNYISIFLFQNYKIVASSEYLCKLLFSFSSINCEFKGIIRNIDFVLMELTRTNFNLCVEFITKWIESSDYQQGNNSFFEIWSSLCSNLDFEKQSFILYTQFFLKDNFIYHKAASEIIHGLEIHKNHIFHFDKDVIEKSNKDDIIFLCRKLLGHIYDIKTLCELFDSILQIKENDETITNIIINVIFRLASEYKYPVLKYFKERQFSVEDDCVKKVYNEIIPNLQKVCEIKNTEKQFPELVATYEQRAAVTKKRNEDNKELIKNANSKSVVMKIIKPVTLLYGQGFCYNVDNKSEFKSSNLAKIEESFYLSKKDIFCPVYAEMERFFFRIAKRGEK